MCHQRLWQNTISSINPIDLILDTVSLANIQSHPVSLLTHKGYLEKGKKKKRTWQQQHLTYALTSKSACKYSKWFGFTFKISKEHISLYSHSRSNSAFLVNLPKRIDFPRGTHAGTLSSSHTHPSSSRIKPNGSLLSGIIHIKAIGRLGDYTWSLETCSV